MIGFPIYFAISFSSMATTEAEVIYVSFVIVSTFFETKLPAKGISFLYDPQGAEFTNSLATYSIYVTIIPQVT